MSEQRVGSDLGPTLTFSHELWHLLVTYGKLPADAPGDVAPGWVSVTWAALTPADRARLYRSMVRCAARAAERSWRVGMEQQLAKLRDWVATGPSGMAATEGDSTRRQTDEGTVLSADQIMALGRIAETPEEFAEMVLALQGRLASRPVDDDLKVHRGPVTLTETSGFIVVDYDPDDD